MRYARIAAVAGAVMLVWDGSAPKAAEVPDAISAPGETVELRIQAEGAQIYECRFDDRGRLTWQFLQPIASLFKDGVAAGLHYAGPTWEIDGSSIIGKVIASKRGRTRKDIPWLRLDVVEHHGDGPLKDVTAVQRINTRGGNLEGSCHSSGALRAMAYSADYLFLRKT